MHVPGLISVVVVNWNGLEYLEECVASVLSQTYSPAELVIVDNGSNDGSREWIRDHLTGRATLVQLDRNTGFGGGVNSGIRASRGEFVALLNNDAVADPEWLSQMVVSMRTTEVGMVASKILFYDRRKVIDKAGHLMYWDGLNRGRGAGETDLGQFDREEEVFFPDGCAALYRRSMLEDVGLFDEQFFAYGDDADLGLRARWRGWLCLYAPGAKAYHRHSRSLGKYAPAKALLVERNRIWVAAKLFPLPLLLASPALTLWRFFWHAWSVVSARGLAGGVAREHSRSGLLVALLRAYAEGFSGLNRILEKRREAFRTRRLTTTQFISLLLKYRISARQLAMRD